MHDPEQEPPEREPPGQELGDQAIVARIQAGDEDALEVLFHAYYEELHDFVRFQVGSPEAAEDLIQNVFLNLWRRRRDWEPKTTLRAYLFGAARNESIKYRKHRQVRRRWERENEAREAPREPGPEEEFRYQEIKDALQKSVSELPERRREVYLLSRQYGLTYKEIAVVMDISPSTVDNQMVEALKFLRDRMRSFLSKVV